VYPVTCYREAMKHAGEDVKTYSSLPQDLTRALQSAIHTKSGRVVPGGQRGRRITRKTSSRARPTTARKKKKTAPAAPLPGRKKPKGFFPRALDFIGPDNASSIPLPLIFLAGLALVLTAAGVIGMITRRLQARRAGGGPPPPEAPT
jgi:hypothetical protein